MGPLTRLFSNPENFRKMPVPVWLMRQAGRYLPEYQALRQEAGSFLALCQNPEAAATVTLQPLKRFNLDAAIIFSDILVIPQALGQALSFPEKGPVLAPYTPETVKPPLNPAVVTPVYQALSRVKETLSSEKDLIGFAGAPWTLACYMLEEKGSKAFDKARHWGMKNPEMMGALITTLTDCVSQHLINQIAAGATVVQLFDSWAGACPWTKQEEWILSPTKEIVRRVKAAYPAIPFIGFPRGIGQGLPDYVSATGVNGVGIDQQTSPLWAARVLPQSVVIQGGIDPQALVCGGAVLADAVDLYRDAFKDRAYIFNLGHGVVPQTPPAHVAAFMHLIHRQ